jgi:hypothetical protein
MMLSSSAENWSSSNSIATSLYQKSIEVLVITQATVDTMDPTHERYPAHHNMLRLAGAIPRMIMTADTCSCFNEFAEKTRILHTQLADLRQLARNLSYTHITASCYFSVLCEEIDHSIGLLHKWKINLIENDDWPWS